MGFSAGIYLGDADDRKAFEDAARTVGLALKDMGDDSLCVWYGGSAWHDFSDALSWAFERGKDEGDVFVPSSELAKLAPLSERFRAVRPRESVRLENLGRIGEEDAESYWHALTEGVASSTRYFVSVPVVGSVSVPAADLRTYRGVTDMFWAPEYGAARDAVFARITAGAELDRAREAYEKAAGTDGEGDAAKALVKSEAALRDAERRARDTEGTERPTCDKTALPAVSLDVRTGSYDCSVEKEDRDPNAAAAFKSDVMGAIVSLKVNDQLVNAIYEFIGENPGYAFGALADLGMVGKAAVGAGIGTLTWNGSW